MQINGFQIKEALKRWENRRKFAGDQFADSIVAFEEDEKEKPQKLIENYTRADSNYAKLQELQHWYNHQVKCNVGKEVHTLSYCVKIVGGLSRVENLWHDACVQKRDRWNPPEKTRSKELTYAKRTVTVKEASKLAEEAAKQASEVRAAIAIGNATNVEIGEVGFKLTTKEYGELFS